MVGVHHVGLVLGQCMCCTAEDWREVKVRRHIVEARSQVKVIAGVIAWRTGVRSR